MKTLRPSFFALTLASFAMSGLNAQTTATTDPVGFTTLTVRPKTNANRAMTLAVLPMERSPSFSGSCAQATFAVVDGRSVITFSSAIFTANQFTGASNRHYFRVENGSNAGEFSEVIANTASSVTIADNLSSILSTSTTFTVVPFWTLSTAFPNGAGLTGGANQGSASSTIDNVILYNTSFSPTTFYWKTNVTPNGWASGNTITNDAIIPPGTGFAIDRRTNSTVAITLPGSVPLGWSAVDVNGSPATNVTRNTLVGSAYPLASKRLADLGLYTGNSNTGLVGAGSAGAGPDIVQIINPNAGGTFGATTNYYFNTVNNRWQTGNTPAEDVTIPEGSAVVIQRRLARPAFTWYIPQPDMAQ